MGNVSEKAKGKAEVLSGTIERSVGKVLGKPGMQVEGAVAQAKGKARQIAAKVVGHAKDVVEAVTRKKPRS